MPIVYYWGMDTCKHCTHKLIIRQTRRTAEQLKKHYYYTAYYFCPHCKRIYHNDKFKVVNENFDLFARSEVASGPIDVEIWTDGACARNGRPSARAAWAFVSGRHEERGYVSGKQTNNTAEAYAIYHALLWAVKEGHKRVKIHSDSQITLHNLRKPLRLIKENNEVFAKIYNVIEKHGLQVLYQKVLGHSGDINNERADKLANSLVGITS